MGVDVAFFRFLNDFAGRSSGFDAFVGWSAQYIMWVIIAIPIAIILFKKGDKRKEFFPTFILAAVAFVLARGILTEIVRRAFYRPRPFLALPDVHLIASLPYRLSSAFPSGTTVSMFAIAFAFLPYNKRLAGVLLVVALWSSLSRVIAGVHYPSDVLGGIVLAYVVVWLVNRFVIRRFSPQSSSQLPQQEM